MPDREHTEEWVRSVLGGPLEWSTLDAATSFHILGLHRGDPTYRGLKLKPAGHEYLFRLAREGLGEENVAKLTAAHNALPKHPIDP